MKQLTPPTHSPGFPTEKTEEIVEGRSENVGKRFPDRNPEIFRGGDVSAPTETVVLFSEIREIWVTVFVLLSAWEGKQRSNGERDRKQPLRKECKDPSRRGKNSPVFSITFPIIQKSPTSFYATYILRRKNSPSPLLALRGFCVPHNLLIEFPPSCPGGSKAYLLGTCSKCNLLTRVLPPFPFPEP